MATPANQLPRFQLPARIRANKTAPDELPTRQALAERIARLPGIEAVDCGDDTLPCQVAMYLHGAAARRTIRASRPQLLCRLGADGIVVHGLDNWAKHQVVMRGWGRLRNDRVLLFLPRDDSELGICWNIVRQAYDSFFNPPACFDQNARPGTRNASSRDMPRFSRTTLQ